MLLIRKGILHTMTAAGSFQGDILIDGGKLLRVERRIDPHILELERVIEADGLHLYPGLMDAHIHLVQASEDETKNMHDLCGDALSSGITTHALWPPDGGACIICHGHASIMTPAEPMYFVHHEGMTDHELAQAMADAVQCGQRLACEVYGEKNLRRLLTLRHDSGCPLVLVHLTGCEAMAQEIIASGCEVIMGACVLRSGSNAYILMSQLTHAGVTLALTADYPATRLHHLPLCAGLCVRGGMDRHAALRTMTVQAAKLLRVENVCGTIEAGKRADLTIFDGDPLMLATAHVMTLSDGKPVQNG
ncbi:MAG: amidohydrolase family protein [Aristaeellaceae bacterium]